MSSEPSTSVAGRYQSWVDSLGSLSPRQQAEAAHLIRLAEELDLRSERPAAALASLSRAIAKTADRLRDEKNALSGSVGPSGGSEVSTGTPGDIVRDIAAQRAKRLEQGGVA
jgi:hypothetical protein